MAPADIPAVRPKKEVSSEVLNVNAVLSAFSHPPIANTFPPTFHTCEPPH